MTLDEASRRVRIELEKGPCRCATVIDPATRLPAIHFPFLHVEIAESRLAKVREQVEAAIAHEREFNHSCFGCGNRYRTYEEAEKCEQDDREERRTLSYGGKRPNGTPSTFLIPRRGQWHDLETLKWFVSIIEESAAAAGEGP